MSRLLHVAGFERTRIVPLAPAPNAKGPGLFVASGVLKGLSARGQAAGTRE
jgi:hypothetical protein